MTTPLPDPHHQVRDAIAVMTAWAPNPKDSSLALDTAAAIVEERFPGNPVAGLSHLMSSLAVLCGLLLTDRAFETGKSPLTILQELAGRYAQ